MAGSRWKQPHGPSFFFENSQRDAGRFPNGEHFLEQ
jgi:hypothetical protein